MTGSLGGPARTQQWRLRKAPGSFDRTIAAEQTVERLMARRGQYGITRVAEVTGLDDLGIPVHCTIRPRSISAATVHSGKGLTAADSLAGALAEAIEVDCSERYRPADLVRGTRHEVARRHAVADLPRHAVPGGRGIPHDLELDWVFGRDLLSAPGETRRVLLPLELVRQGRDPQSPGVLVDQTMSHGLASGNVPEEAISHALAELIERDAVSIFTFRAKYLREDLRGRYARIDTGTLTGSARALVDRIQRKRQVVLVDVTTDVGVPTVICKLSSDEGWFTGGFGASLSAEHAVVRAITEAVQASAVNIQGAREDLAFEARDPRIHERAYGLESARALELFDDAPIREVSLSSLPTIQHDYVDQDLDSLLTSVRAAGIRHVYVCDLSDDGCLDFHVVRVVVPDLESVRLDCLGPRRLRYVL